MLGESITAFLTAIGLLVGWPGVNLAGGVPTAAATSTLIFVSGHNNSVTAGGGDHFQPAIGPEDLGLTTTEALAEQIIPEACALSNLRTQLYRDVGGAGENIVFTLQKNGADETDIGCTITGAVGTQDHCEDAVGSVSFAAGDRISWEITPTATLGAADISVQISATCVISAANRFFLMGRHNTTSTSERYGNIAGATTSASGTITNIEDHEVPFPVAVTLDKLYVRAAAALPASATVTYSVYVCPTGSGACASPGGSTLTFQLTDAIQEGSDTGSVSVSAGDNVVIHATGTGSPGTVNTAVSVGGTESSGKQFWAFCNAGGLTADGYGQIPNGNGGANATETLSYRTVVAAAGTITDIGCHLDPTPTAGNALGFQLRLNATSSLGDPCTISEGEVEKRDNSMATSGAFAAGDGIGFFVDETGTMANDGVCFTAAYTVP